MRTALAIILLLLTGCVYSPPEAIRHALDVQAKYTATYVEHTLPLVDDEETKLIGIELVKNAEALKKWSRLGAEKDEKENHGSD